MREPILLPLDQAELTVDLNGSLMRRTVHPSGLRVLTELMPSARSATIGFWVGVGSRDEQADRDDAPGSLGSTHFLEHLLFKGTPTRNAYEIATTFDQMGAEHNALTAKEYTCYYAKVRDADLPEAVAALADMVTNSVLDPEEFETERGVILEELAMAADDLADVASEQLFAEVLRDHPLGRPIGGLPETIRGARRDDVDRHYRDRYDPSTLVVTAAGAVDHDALVAQVLAALNASPEERWHTDREAAPRRRAQASDELAVTAASASPRICVTERPSEQINLLIGTPGLRATDPRRFAFGIMNSVLGGGMSSRLFQEIREKRGLAYTAYSFGASYSDTGVFGMYAGMAPEKASEVLELSQLELQKLADSGITAEEHERALGQIAGSSALALEDSETRMGRLARAEIGTGELYDLDTSLALIHAVTGEEVREVAAALAGRPLTVVAVGDVARSGLQPNA
ncbi:M16 family metallopeptidase [Leucobacter chromiireducens]|uniref:Insulinase family protein n=1 Tax=Leucobacter chromiireducens subsp. solipictus TaxID=398235 RepID=A0ABS1SCB9_9MICO|nr:pitrilysin family protein [Leucobacter chromiireducens]MBL3678192.1 insulinase family protein [Leucobacter chromiireducens subsp. solipictus]